MKFYLCALAIAMLASQFITASNNQAFSKEIEKRVIERGSDDVISIPNKQQLRFEQPYEKNKEVQTFKEENQQLTDNENKSKTLEMMMENFKRNLEMSKENIEMVREFETMLDELVQKIKIGEMASKKPPETGYANN